MEQKPIVIYSGRFQPFHSAHKETYDNLVKKFGKENVAIVTSNKVEPPKSPFDFNEKKKIITTMFKDIPADSVVQVKNTYKAEEITKGLPDNVSVVFVVGNKDAERLAGGKYFKPYKEGEKLVGYKEHGYYYVAPANKIKIDGTTVREVFAKGKDEAKEKLFKELYGDMNKTIYDLLNKKIVEDKVDEDTDFLLKESEEEPNFLLTEGGAYGHLSHFHDVRTNSFADLREFVDTVLKGKMDYARIKTDGMNLMFSFIDGHLRAARNKGDLKDFGKKSMTRDDLNKKYEGKENVQNAFVAAGRDLQQAIGKLPRQQIDEIFENGKNWMSVEIITPETKNVVPYGNYQLRFHGIRKYDEKGNVIGEDKDAADKLAKMIEDIKQNKQDTFEIKSLEVASFPPLPDFKAQQAYFHKKIDNLQHEFKMKDKNTIADVFESEVQKLIKTHAREARYAIPKAEMDGLVKRWAFNDKAYSARDMASIKNDTFREWAVEFDKEDAKYFAKEIANKFEYLTLELGARVMKNLSSFMVANPQKAVQELKKSLDDVIRQVQATKNPELIEKMKYELGRLAAIGGVNAIAPEEGVTFIFKDNFYKITGAFAPLNQLLGLLRYNRSGESEKEEEKKE